LLLVAARFGARSVRRSSCGSGSGEACSCASPYRGRATVALELGLWQALAVAALVAAFVYAVFVAILVIAGRREGARAAAAFVPDCVVLFKRLLSDPRVPRRKKLVLAALIPYLLMPFDLVPDFIPVAGYLDDAVIVAFALRYVLRGSGPDLITAHWPGPPASLSLMLRLAGGQARA
jgi:uncharacterized membrane protein YkvA (DUF1232 family)